MTFRVSSLPQTLVLGPRQSLTDSVHAALHDAITMGVLAPGERLREVELARHFAISPTPVREAIRRLEREGLVTVLPYRGAAVAQLDAAELADLYDIHELLECRAVRLAAAAHPRDTSQLDGIMRAMDELLRSPEPDHNAFNRLDLQFHRTLNELSGNLALAQLTEQIHLRIQSIRIHVAGHIHGRPAASHAQHAAILAAVQVGDADRAEALARDHIHTVRETVLRMLAARERGGSDGAPPSPIDPQTAVTSERLIASEYNREDEQ
jgi:DNA-binding GntR family transcriptional regulator